jgi:serine protease Do
MKLWKTAVLSAALFGAAGVGAAMTPIHGQDTPRAAASRVEVFSTGGGRIGVSVTDVEASDTKATSGVVIDSVMEDSPAEKAGLRKGDVVVEFDGERVRSVRQFTRLVSETPAGRQVATAVMRAGQRVSVNVTPRESSPFRVFEDGRWNAIENLRGYAPAIPPVPARPTTPRTPSAPRPPRPPALERFFTSANPLGVTVDELSDQLAEYFGVKSGVLVTSVSPDSAAMKAGVKAGDVIVSVNGSSIERSGDIRARMRRLEAGEEFTLDVVRDRQSMTLKGKVEAPAARRWTTRTIL